MSRTPEPGGGAGSKASGRRGTFRFRNRRRSSCRCRAASGSFRVMSKGVYSRRPVVLTTAGRLRPSGAKRAMSQPAPSPSGARDPRNPPGRRPRGRSARASTRASRRGGRVSGCIRRCRPWRCCPQGPVLARDPRGAAGFPLSEAGRTHPGPRCGPGWRTSAGTLRGHRFNESQHGVSCREASIDPGRARSLQHGADVPVPELDGRPPTGFGSRRPPVSRWRVPSTPTRRPRSPRRPRS